MNRFLLFVCFSIAFVFTAYAQNDEGGYKTYPIDKQIIQFVDTHDNKTPLNVFIAYIYAAVNEQWEATDSLSSIVLIAKPNKPKTKEYKEWLLNRTIKELIISKDSVAGVILTLDSMFTIWYFRFENERWLNAGEDYGGRNIEETRLIFLKKAEMHLELARKIKQLGVVSTDTLAFVNYLREKSKPPKEFLLEALSHYRLIIYGEVHHRRASWDLMRKLIKDAGFIQSTGTVFLELSMSAQPDINRFFSNKIKDSNIVLGILRKEEITGWNDRGMYEFLLDLWDVNAQLPLENKIKVIATDFPRPFYSTITTKEQYKAFFNDLPDRNLCMADIIKNHIHSSSDKRSCIFIVGSGHAYKSSALNRGTFQKNGRSAASLLFENLPNESLFSITAHSPMLANNGYLYGKLRKGLFDYVFAASGNKPLAFKLKGSPFGREPFDANSAICFQAVTGTYENNYDAYVFLTPLDTEQINTHLYELYSDDFVEEMKRRAHIIGIEQDNYLGMKIKDLTREQIISILKADEGRHKWNFTKSVNL